ncbi:hypothetical protein TKK_0019614 [Trichogramma kaykai]
MQRFLLCLVVLLKIGNLMTESVGLKADNKMDMYLAANENSYFRDPSQLRTELANFQPAWDKLASRNLVRDESDLNNYKWYNIEAADSQLKLENDPDEAEIARFSDVMLRLILQPGPWDPPLVIIDGPSDGSNAKGPIDESDDLPRIDKRSRYYRPYPWTNKRQNSRSYHRSGDYDPYNPCTPTRHDVFQLLVALHDAQKGNRSRLVNICNRRRPASDIYTNIRFLGRKK